MTTMRGKEIRDALHAGRPVFATALIAAHPHYPDAVKQAGADFVFIDAEHNPLGRETLAWMCLAFSAMDIPPVVRIPSPDPHEASKVLDGGYGGGIIGPYIETVEQVRGLAGVARYRPIKGERLQQVLRDPSTLEPALRTHLEAKNEDTILILTIESAAAVENLDALCDVPGVDAVLVGPYDLSCSLGIPHEFDHPRFDEALHTVFRKARAHNIGAGVHLFPGIQQQIRWTEAGGNLIMHSSDVVTFRQQLAGDLSALRRAIGG
jgi:2-keto-3-deoxy-L-rhamnonate aldolase RhmA